MGAVILRECPAYTTHPIKIISVWSQAFSSVLSAGIDPGRIGSGSSPISHCTSFPTFTSYLQAFTNIPINHSPHVMFNHISYKRILRQRSIRALTVDGQKGREKSVSFCPAGVFKIVGPASTFLYTRFRIPRNQQTTKRIGVNCVVPYFLIARTLRKHDLYGGVYSMKEMEKKKCERKRSKL